MNPFLQSIAKDNSKIFDQNFYEIGGEKISFGFAKEEHSKAELFPQPRLSSINNEMRMKRSGKTTEIIFAAEETFATPTNCVLNFASPTTPGGGYLAGAPSQEEALCRESTLYLSLTSSSAQGMYRFNKQHNYPEGSDFVIHSPNVEVFRKGIEEDHDFLPVPFKTAVLSVAAVDMRGDAAKFPISEIHRIMTHRLRYTLSLAAHLGYKSITLGAWGCGVFANKPEDVATYFKTVLLDENYESHFERIIFAIYDPQRPETLETFTNILSR